MVEVTEKSSVAVVRIGLEPSESSKKANPLNPLSAPVRRSLLSKLSKALDSSSVKGVVLVGAGSQHFSAGADISEFQSMTAPPPEDEEESDPPPSLVDVVTAIQNARKPVVAGVRGVCMGGGMEVALAADYRVGSKSCKMGLPEVRIGLIPGAHGTQRLARLVTPEVALDLVTTGRIVSANEALRHKILDRLHEGGDGKSLERYCVDFVRTLLATNEHERRVKLQHRPAPATLVRACDARVQGAPPPASGAESVRAAIRALRACGTAKSYEEGCAAEEDIFWDLLYNSTQGRGFRHVFFAERAAQKRGLDRRNPNRDASSASEIQVRTDPANSTVGVIGAGTMGSGIALSFLFRSQLKHLILVDVNEKGLKRGVDFIKKTVTKKLKEKADSVLSKLIPTTSLQDLRNCNLVVEAVFENLKLKQNIFRQLHRIVQDPHAVLATNTSTLSIDDVVRDLPQATRSRCAGMHFFSPANIMRLVEIIRSSYSSNRTLEVLRHVTKVMGKVGVVVGNCDGFVGNRMVAPYTAECVFVVQDVGTGAGVKMVDDAIGGRSNKGGSPPGFGMAMGPFQMGDLAGNDIGYLIRKEKNLVLDKTGKPGAGRTKGMRYTDLGDLLVTELGRTGQKSMKGWYDYVVNKKSKRLVATVSPEVSAFVSTFTGKSVTTPLPPDEIVKRCLYPLVNEGFKILEENIASDPGDVDIIYVYGYGWPPWRGGPMFWADHEVGLPNLLRTLESYHARYPGSAYFEPSSLLRKCVKLDVGVQEYYNKKIHLQGMSKM